MSTGPLTDLIKTVTVPARPDRAFTVFVDEIGTWWPLGGFSVGGASSTVAFERDAAGRAARLVETLADGTTTAWGSVTRWDPPRAVAFTWHPGERAESATHVEVTFTAEGDGTLVRLAHGGWSARTDGTAARERYDTGWEVVLAPLAAAAADR
jgi:Activator of Hsp90 ATPase homolog 1-like protein